MKVGEQLKVAIFRCMEDGCLSGLQTIASEDYERIATYVRISEYIGIEFQPLKNDEVIRGALHALDAAEMRAREELQRALDRIKDQRAQLLQLTHSA